MKVEIANLQSALHLDIRAVRTFARFAMEQAFPAGATATWQGVSLVLVDNEKIRIINQRHFSTNETTDVISFRYNPIPGEAGLSSGEIIVNVQRASELPRPLPVSRELALYIAHGCDHLTGSTDDDRKGMMRMRRRELRWLKLAARAGLIDSLVLARSRHNGAKIRSTRGKGRRP